MIWDLIIFDCDGVLVDSEPIAYRIFSETLLSEGIKISQKEYTPLFVGYSIESCIKRAEEYSGKTLSDNFAKNYYSSLFAEFKRELKPIPYVKDALEAIPFPKCVASSGKHEKMKLTLGLTGLFQMFNGKIFSSSDVKRGKPYPDLFLYAANNCGALPENCAVIEDSKPGILAAVSAGMKVFGYVKNADPIVVEDYTNTGAVVFSSMKDLPKLLN